MKRILLEHKFKDSAIIMKIKDAMKNHEGEPPSTITLCRKCQFELLEQVGRIPDQLFRKRVTRQTYFGVERCIIHPQGTNNAARMS